MPYINTTDYNPGFPFTNSHINTMFPFFFRTNINPVYTRERYTTPDDDFLDVDFIQNDNNRIAIICHGLEGSSNSQYIRGTSLTLSAHQWDVAALNYRGCSGMVNKQLRMYHSGATDDLHMVVQSLESQYDEIVLVGFSLGGNLILKYSADGIFDISDKISKLVAISAPTDLHAGSLHLQKRSNWLYEYRFLRNLRIKMTEKKKQFPKSIDLDLFKKIETLYDFDDYFTAPVHGFEDAIDYYTQCSCGQFLENIKKPTYLINALDDPFLPEESYPISIAQSSELFTLITPQYGGHVGFTNLKYGNYWDESILLEIISSKT